MAAERGPGGIRLVAIDEHGDRSFVVVKPAAVLARDTNPTISPDDRWIVFASSRGRPLDETSLWIAPLAVEAVPRPLTKGPAIDSHPTWTPDGTAIVFASAQPHGDFDLWRLPVHDGQAGEPVQLTRGRGHEITPAVAADGTIIYAEVTATPGEHGAQIESHLEALAPDGTVQALTEGPGDSSPALSPDGATLAFARPVIRGETTDGELWRLTRADGTQAPLVDLPLTDESGPVWSPDGRFVFATSILRKADGSALFSSVVSVELAEHPTRARILEDHAGAIPRLTPAIARTPLDVAALRGDPEYLPELGRIMAKAIADEAATPPPPAPARLR